MGNYDSTDNKKLLDDEFKSHNITTSLDGEIVDRKCTKQELRILNGKFTTGERYILNNRHMFYIIITISNGDLVNNISEILTDRDLFKSYISHVRRNRLIQLIVEDPNINKLFSLLNLRISVTAYPDILLVGDVEYGDTKAVIRVSSYAKNTKFSTISDVYQLRKYMTTLDTDTMRSIKHYIIASYIEQYGRLYFLILSRSQVIAVIDNLNR